LSTSKYLKKHQRDDEKQLKKFEDGGFSVVASKGSKN
jgi:hypothetical protein